MVKMLTLFLITNLRILRFDRFSMVALNFNDFEI